MSRLVSGRRFVLEISSVFVCACAGSQFAVRRACADESKLRRFAIRSCRANEDISGTKRRPATRHISFDSSRPSAPEYANSEKIGVELGNCACAVGKLRYLEQISTNLCAVDGFLFSSSRWIEWYVFRRSAHARKLSRERNVAQLRNTYHSIRLDELNQNLSSALRLVEISTRYRRFTSAHAQLPNSSPIFLQFAD